MVGLGYEVGLGDGVGVQRDCLSRILGLGLMERDGFN